MNAELKAQLTEEIPKIAPRIVELADLSGLVTEWEGGTLAVLAAAVELPNVIVEIGSYTGKSTSYLANGGYANVYAIDLWNLRLPGEKKKRNKNKYDISFNSTSAMAMFDARTRNLDNVIGVRAESRQIAKVWARPIGLLFIDGAHDTKSVTADYEGFSPFIVPGGHLAMHDATPGSKVDKVINDVVIPSGLWGERRQVDRLAVFQRLEG